MKQNIYQKTGFLRLSLFICLLVFSQTARAGVIPKPEEILGFKIGDDYHLATYDQAIDYLRKVASVSDRIRLFSIGPTSCGLDMIYAVISSAENMAELDRYKDIARRLSLVKGLSPAEAEKLAAEGKPVVWIDGGLHSSECAPAQHNIQLAYNLVSASDEKTLRILKDVILILVFANPDGMNMLADWYHPNIGTPYEVSSMPWLYHKYAGHDNNRDALVANLIETRNMARLANKEWFPVIIYNHHQTAPFPARIWTPPNSEPTNPNVHPLVVRWQNLIGSAMSYAFDAEGKEGAISRITFDTWYPGYMTQVQDSHNIISILTETALYRYATPYFYTVRDFPREYSELTMSAFYPSPWRGGWWRLRDAVDYCLTASMSVLDVASRYKKELLHNKYMMGSDVIERFKREPPYAWIIAPQQVDPGAVDNLLDSLNMLGIEIHRAEEDFTADGVSYPRGTYIIPMAQPFALFVKNVFEEQKYPDLRKYPDLWQGIVSPIKFEGSPFEAYDMMGWTLPYQFGVKITSAGSPLEVKTSRVEKAVFAEGEITGRGGAGWLLDPSMNASAAAVNRVLKNGGKAARTTKNFDLRGKTYPAGTFIVSGLQAGAIDKIVRELRIKATAVAETPNIQTMPVLKPRLAVYQSWVPSEAEGWLRLTLERYEFEYKTLHDAEIRAGSLRQSFDVIILPDHYSADLLVNGHEKGTMPPQYVGGLGKAGIDNLRSFAQAGGTLIFLNKTSDLALESFAAPARNVIKKAKPEEFSCSGSIFRLEFDVSHPVAYGMPESAPAVFASGCVFDIHPSFEPGKAARSIAKFPSGNLLMSGWVNGEKLLYQKSAVMEASLGQGRLILFGISPIFRGMSVGTFKLLFNSIFYGASPGS